MFPPTSDRLDGGRASLPQPARATDRSAFLKSRVYAKLLRGLILERYQTFNGHSLAVATKAQDSEAFQIGKQIKTYATIGGVALDRDGNASG
jgi:hypothetical protein